MSSRAGGLALLAGLALQTDAAPLPYLGASSFQPIKLSSGTFSANPAIESGDLFRPVLLPGGGGGGGGGLPVALSPAPAAPAGSYAGPFSPPWNDDPANIQDWGAWCAFEQREGCYACANTAGAGKYCTAMCAGLGCPGFETAAPVVPAGLTMWLDLSGRLTSQSSTGWSGHASRAIDGNQNNHYSGQSCTHTGHDDNPWWQIELGAKMTVHAVKVTNRGDCCGHRLNGLRVTVDGQHCASGITFSQGETKEIVCTTPVKGGTVRLAIPGRREYLTLCEVGVRASLEPLIMPDPVTTASGQGHSGVFTDELIARIPTPVELPATLYIDARPSLDRCQVDFNGEFGLHAHLHSANPEWCNAEKELCLRFEGSPVTSWALVSVPADHTDSTVLARISTTANQIPEGTTTYRVTSAHVVNVARRRRTLCQLDSVTISRTALFEPACTQSLGVVGSAATMSENCADDKGPFLELEEVTSVLAENDNPRFNLIGYGRCQTEFGNDGTYRSVEAGSLQECQTRCMASNAAYNAGFEYGEECLGIEYSFHESSCKLFQPGEYLDRTDCSRDESCTLANLYRCYRYLGERYKHLVSGQLSVNDKCPLYESRRLLTALKPAAENFHQCSEKIESVAGALGDLKKGSQNVKDMTHMLSNVVEDMAEVVELIEAPPPKGSGIGQLLSQVPEYGVYIKMGLKTAETVSKSLLKVARKVETVTAKFDKAINYTEKVFSRANQVAGPVSQGLSGGAHLLDATIGCSTSVCNDVNEELESISSKAVENGALEAFGVVSQAGEICYAALSPIDKAMQVIRAAAHVFEHLLDPARLMLDAMTPFVEMLHNFVNEAKKVLNTDQAKCVVAIFKPVADVSNLLTCPIMEVGNLFDTAVETLLVQVGTVVQKMGDDLITNMIETAVPENIGEVVPEIPDFRSHLLPSDLVSLTCIATSMQFPEHASTIQMLATKPWNAQIFPDNLQEQLLAKALSATRIPLPDVQHRESACVEAYKSMTETNEFQSCKGVAKPIAEIASAGVEVALYQFCPLCSIARSAVGIFHAILG